MTTPVHEQQAVAVLQRSAVAASRRAPTSRGPTRLAVEALWRDRPAVAGGLVVAAMLVMAVAAPLITPYDPVAQDLGATLQPPSAKHPLGTDEFGRDVLSRIIAGSRISLTLGFISVAISVALGLPIGLAAGYAGGQLEAWVMRGMDVLLAFPGILLILVVVAVLGIGLTNAMIAIGIASVPAFVRVVRASTLSAKQEEYVVAAWTIGADGLRTTVTHLLPNVLGPLLVISTLRVATAILTGSTLSYLGLGAQPPTPEWGSMLAEATRHVRDGWWLALFPGLAIMFVVLGVNLLGDGIRDALDPKLRTR